MNFKTYLIAGMFLLAAVFPILFIPLLALTLVVLFLISPYFVEHNVWTQTKEDIEEDLRHHPSH